jgi:hypothetical protein
VAEIGLVFSVMPLAEYDNSLFLNELTNLMNVDIARTLKCCKGKYKGKEKIICTFAKTHL